MYAPMIFDIEIVKGILGRNEKPLDGIEYCAGWHDHANMGISVIGAYDYAENRYRVFCKDNFEAFLELAHQRLAITFNGLGFDNKVIECELGGVPGTPDRHYDLLAEIWSANGISGPFDFKTHVGYGLDAMCEKNFGTRKSGNGALAPVLWQRGQIGKVIDYCLNDVKLTKQLFDHACISGVPLRNPRGGSDFELRIPEFEMAIQ